MSLMQLETISADTVDKINGLINVDQNLLFDHDKFREISFKLNKKINALKDNIAVSLPSQFSTLDQNEFLLFCSRIRSLSKKLELIKKKEQQIRHSTNNFKLAIESNKDDYSTNGLLKQFILKSLSLSRERDYFSTLITLENNKLDIEKKLQKYNSICEKKRLVENSRKKQSGNTDQEINLHIEQAEVLKDLLLSYQELKAVSKSLIETRCTNLRTYMIDLLAFIQKQLREILTDELEASLQKLNYPHVTLEVNRAENLENLRKKIHDHIYYLLVIDVPFLEEEQDGVCSQNSVIETLIKPFEKRFKFHFFTSRKTNDINKPEWYLSQILQWIKEQQDFFSRLIQPIFDKIEYWNKKSALILFINKLVCLIREKLDADIKKLFDNSEQFLHTIDELLTFSNQLVSFLDSTESSSLFSDQQHFYTCLHIICENQFLFTHWLSLEKQIWQKYLDEMFSNQSQLFCSNFNIEKSPMNNSDLKDLWPANNSNFSSSKSTKCAECFILIIKSIQDRYFKLPYPSKQLRFVSLQIDLLTDFHLRLCQILRDEANNIFSKTCLGVLNTVNYVIKVLDEWKNSTFYIQLQFYKVKFDQFVKKYQLVENLDANNFLSDEGEDRIGEELSDSFDKNIKSAKPFLEIEGTIFDDLLPSYEKVKNDIVKQIVQKCKWEFTSRANVYKHEKWMCMPLVSEFYKQTLTDSASDMLISLRNMLHLLKDSINQEIFNTIIKKLSSELDIFYYKDLILHTTFNEGGIHQLDYDINKYLMPILNEFAIDFNVNSFFRLTNESISLIKMKQGPAILLKGLIEKALVIEENRGIIQSSDYDLKTNVYNAKNALKELNIHHLTCEQSRKILSLRADLMN